MSRRSGMWSRFSVWLRLSFALALIAAAWSATGFVWGRKPSHSTEDLEWAVVRRDDLDTTLLVGGDLQPTKQTTVTCQVEDVADSDGTMILSVIPNGTVVKKGAELCRLDSSQIEELARQEQITVNQVRADCLGAQLLFETAGIALREYQEGLVTQWTKEFEGRIALGQSDTQRQADRLTWAEGMVIKGYLSESQLLTERQLLAKAQHELGKANREFQVFRRFQVPKEIQTLRGQIETAETNYRVEADRLKVQEDRLAYLGKQVENCIVRAPQDGVVVYANGNKWRSQPIEPGTRVYQDQVMFVLPDLTQMEVEISVHETMAPRVRVGMKAEVRIASLADRVIPGRVGAIDLLPTADWKQWDDTLRRFMVRVRLDQTPPHVLPFMSAIVQIDTGRVPDALVIPVEAMSVVDGQQSCYVAAADGLGLERRAITTRRATTDLLEVTGGLNEGERVVLRPLDVDGIPVDDRTRDPATDFARDRTASPSRPEAPARAS